MRLSVVIPTHNPHPLRLRRTLDGLRAQDLPAEEWELILVDNASSPALTPGAIPAPDNLRIVSEPRLGLTHARARGFHEARGDLIVMVDDDNVLAPDYLRESLLLMTEHPRLGAAGGRSLPEFETPPPPWVREFDGLLACRDLGPHPLLGGATLVSGRLHYPLFAPIGAGMVLRREAAQTWLRQEGRSAITDRQGDSLSSGGDNGIVLSVLRQGLDVGYFPSLSLRHLIPAARTTRDYLARLNRGIAKSWIQVLTQNGACPWGAIPRWTVPLRQLKAWFTSRAWAGPAEYVRWQGACGHFEGQASLRSPS